jgi:hypothetical protein
MPRRKPIQVGHLLKSQASLPWEEVTIERQGKARTSSPIASRRKIRWHVDEQRSSKSASSSTWLAKDFGSFCFGLPSTNSPKLKALLSSITIMLTTRVSNAQPLTPSSRRAKNQASVSNFARQPIPTHFLMCWI